MSPPPRSDARHESPPRSDRGLPGDNEEDEEGVEARVIDGQPKINGDRTWLCEIEVPRPGAQQWGGRRGTLVVRGPLHLDRKGAEEDCELFKEAHKRGGVKELQKARADRKATVWK